jgi:hypothetical protein
MSLQVSNTEFNAWVAGANQLAVEALDRWYESASDALVTDFVYREPGGDASKEYRRTEGYHVRARGRQDVGPTSYDLPDMSIKRRFAQRFPRGWVFGPFRQDIRRWPTMRPENTDGKLPEAAQLIREQFSAIEREVPLQLSERILDSLIHANGGHGGTQVWKNHNENLPFFDLGNTIWTSNKANANILTPTVSDLGAPTIRDAKLLMDAAQAHFLEVDAYRKSLVDTSAIRESGNLRVITTNSAWDTAFQDLRDNPNYNPGGTDPAINDATLENKWQGKFVHYHTTSALGEAWAPWVRIYLFGDRPEDRPIIWGDDLPLSAFTFQKDPHHVDYGSAVSYYLDAWNAATGVLMKPTV